MKEQKLVISDQAKTPSPTLCPIFDLKVMTYAKWPMIEEFENH